MSGAELGSTSDPRVLVPGDQGALVRSVWSLRELGDSLSSAGRGLSRLDTDDGWRGAAADAFRERYSAEPPRWREAGECFHHAADAVDRYLDALQRGQRQAAEAVESWNRGQTVTAAATAEFERTVRQVNSELASRAVAGVATAAPALTFVDPGEEHRARARSELERARAQVGAAGTTPGARSSSPVTVHPTVLGSGRRPVT